MAEEADESEKTEDPTQKKLEQVHERGDVAKSQEVSTWFSLVGATLAIGIFSEAVGSGLSYELKGIFEHAGLIALDDYAAIQLWKQLSLSLILILGLPLSLVLLFSILGNLVQHRLVWSVHPVLPKLSKVSPLSGAKRLFSRESLLNFAKGLAKISIVSGLMIAILWPERDRLDVVISSGLEPLLYLVKSLSLKMLIGIVAFMTVVAAIDFLWQRQRWFEKQKMTVRELKDEFKQTEGSPEVRAKIRQLRRERSRQRMIQNVPEATVVITNPTHYSIALKYEKGMVAPVCVAKGVDAIALRIREAAREFDVPLVENPPLARALYATVELDEGIPEDHYQAVAQVISYVMRLKSGAAWKPISPN